mmetsp:Transcript_103066/g.295632  ORF Transcript_103066/g.295632 Transcript_103066/m.295632 type:complete len:235 (-) Transcript_103066:270-974(-)
MNYSNFQQFADHWNETVGHDAHPPSPPRCHRRRRHHYQSTCMTTTTTAAAFQVHCNLPYGNSKSCPEGWGAAAYGYKWLDWNISMSCKMGAEYLRGGNDCCDEGNCPRGSDYDDYFYDGSGNCVNGAGWICAGIESDCSGYQGVFEDQFYTLANVFELDTSSASYSSTWAPTGSPTPVPTPGPTPLPTTPVPTAIPTPQPTPLPTPLPTSAPSFAPTPLPTSAPTLAPTNSTRR